MTAPLEVVRQRRGAAPPTEHLDPSERLSGRLDGRRLLLVSNREPYVKEKDEAGGGFRRTAGGLVTALDPVMRSSRGVWVAWDPEGRGARHQVPAEEPRFTLRQVPLTKSQVRDYYSGFANRALWPLCHYFMDQCHFDESQWREYVGVNSQFADAVLEESGPDDLIWIHDYHFCLLPQLVRERRGTGGPIGFFLHIPFPAEEVFRIIPWRRQILRGLLGADVVGFHVASYAAHFLESCARLLGADVDLERGVVYWEGRQVQVGAFPIGIDVAAFDEIARRPKTQRRARALHRSLGVETMVLGVDRLDYSKGIPARLAAVDSLLEHHPEHKRRVSFVQIAVPSRTGVKEYRDLKREIDELVGRINGRHGDAEWQPIRYVYRGLPREELIAHYLAADVALITPLRDGMNLVAKEYCASKVDGDGVLVLSEFTGAAQELGEHLLVVNPFAVEEMAESLHEALVMPERERRRHMEALRARVAVSDIGVWVADMLDSLGAVGVGDELTTRGGSGS